MGYGAGALRDLCNNRKTKHDKIVIHLDTITHTKSERGAKNWLKIHSEENKYSDLETQ